jgi:hypothetical protein
MVHADMHGLHTSQSVECVMKDVSLFLGVRKNMHAVSQRHWFDALVAASSSHKESLLFWHQQV